MFQKNISLSKFENHIIIVGSARSGTSWLCELLARPHRYRLLFEPEHEFNTKDGHLLCDRWIEDTVDAGESYTYLKRVFSNKVDNDWIAQHSNRKWKRHLWPFIPKKFVIKFVRCNLAASYINQDFNIPVIHIIRNPYDVIESQQRVKFPWLYDLSRFEKQDRLSDLVKRNYNFDFKEIKSFSEIEKLTFRWCLENVVALDLYRIKKDNFKLIKFEDLRSDQELFLKICKEFNLQPYFQLEAVYGAPSSKSHRQGLKGEGPKNCSLSDEEINSIGEVLRTFRQEFYPIK